MMILIMLLNIFRLLILENQVATKGAALALKARYALYFGDYEIAATAAKACMDLGIYKLHKDYGDLFYTKNAEESIFLLPRSTALLIGNIGDAKSYYPRTAGGFRARFLRGHCLQLTSVPMVS